MTGICGKCGSVKGDRGCETCSKEYSRKWREKNKDRLIEYNRLYRKRNANSLAEYESLRTRNPVTAKINRKIRKEWLHAGDVTNEQLEDLYVKSSGRCHYCGVDTKARLYKWNPAGFDHVIPRAAGGRHTISNMVVCCGPCNRRKSNFPPPPEYDHSFLGDVASTG